MSMEYKGCVKMLFSKVLEQTKKQLKEKWKAAKTRKELENAYNSVCELLLKTQKENNGHLNMLSIFEVRIKELNADLSQKEKEIIKYKQMYVDELQNRLELAKLVEEKGGNQK